MNYTGRNGANKSQKCDTCQNAVPNITTGRGCPWSRHFEPVPGWKAKPTSTGSYAIEDCPMYLQDPPRQKPHEYEALVLEERKRKYPSKRKSPTTHLTYKGKTRNVAEWAQIMNLTTTVILSRIKRGWSIEEALTTPKDKRGGGTKPVKCTNVATGEITTYPSIAAAVNLAGFSQNSIYRCLKGIQKHTKGHSFEYI